MARSTKSRGLRGNHGNVLTSRYDLKTNDRLVRDCLETHVRRNLVLSPKNGPLTERLDTLHTSFTHSLQPCKLSLGAS